MIKQLRKEIHLHTCIYTFYFLDSSLAIFHLLQTYKSQITSQIYFHMFFSCTELLEGICDSVPGCLRSPGSSAPMCAGWDRLCCNCGAESSGCSLCGGRYNWQMNQTGNLWLGFHCCGNCPAETPGEPGQRPLEDVWCGCWRCSGWKLKTCRTIHGQYIYHWAIWLLFIINLWIV